MMIEEEIVDEIVVTGSDGYINSRLIAYLRRFGKRVAVTDMFDKASPLYLDLADSMSFDYACLAPGTMVVVCAAISSPDVCKNQYELAYRVNVSGTVEFIRSCLERGCRIVFFSSDTVFGGSGEGIVFDENSLRTPVGEYGFMKKEVEDAFLGVPGFIALRLSYVVSRYDKYTSYLLDCASKGQVAEVFDPLERSAVALGDVLDVILSLAGMAPDQMPQACNLCGPECVSRLEMAAACKEVLAPALEWRVVVPGEPFYQARPKRIELVSRHLEKILSRNPKSVREEYASIY